ncbi:glycoside hydrolase family protein [Vibrio viridaestus]|uniref:Lysozyme n=1 Tax=Vibrio viridaestus TaxID=2487322 RepID=A0A3N9TGX7_9VIBR|nr:lysozyme [Vibrio viridaestus]RQW63439.1 lysozyme [Vibrio viridaestus]
MRPNKLMGAVLFGSVALTGAIEGLRNDTYQDMTGIPTACYGETEGISLDDSFSDEECAQMLAVSLSYHNEPFEELHYQLKPNIHIAVLDFTYNLGTNALRRSTLYYKLKNKQYICDEFNRWVYVGGKDCRVKKNNCYGIVKRRNIETQLCKNEISVKQALSIMNKSKTDREVIAHD